MIYKQFGKTGKMVSALGFGGMRFLQEDYATQEGKEKCAELLVKANELGVNYFDTAPAYCGGRSEEIFGMAFPKMKKQFYVSTKSRLSDDPDADAVQRRIEASLKKMGLEKIHFYNMWCILNLEQYERIMRAGGPYEGALRAKDAGLIEHICFSAHCDGRDVEKIVKDGGFEGVTLGYNVINANYREQGMQAAYSGGLGVVTMNSLGGGVIPGHPEHFQFLKKDRDDNIVKAALRYNASHKAVSVVLSGMSSMKQLLENVSAFDDFNPGSDYFEEVNRKRSSGMNDLCTGCDYCSGCPNGLEINKLMQSYNEYVFSNKNPRRLLHDLHVKWEYAQDRIFDCIECGQCEKKCTQKLPVIERIKTINNCVQDDLRKTRKQMERYFGDKHMRNIGIYGIGALALQLYEKYRICYPDECSNIYLFDKDEKKWGSAPLHREWRVHAPGDIEKFKIKRLIICNANHYEEICRELQHLVKDEIELMQYNL